MSAVGVTRLIWESGEGQMRSLHDEGHAVSAQ